MAHGADGQGFVYIPTYANDEFSRVFPSGCRLGQRFTIPLINVNPLLDRLTKLLVYIGFIVSMDAAKHESGTSANVALVLFRPFDYLEVPITRFHSVTSRIAFSTSRS